MFNKFILNTKNKIALYNNLFQQRKNYVFFKCPKCKNMLRLPKNKGKLKVTCPICKYELFKKT